jgi:hypothetical protein
MAHKVTLEEAQKAFEVYYNTKKPSRTGKRYAARKSTLRREVDSEEQEPPRQEREAIKPSVEGAIEAMKAGDIELFKKHIFPGSRAARNYYSLWSAIGDYGTPEFARLLFATRNGRQTDILANVMKNKDRFQIMKTLVENGFSREHMREGEMQNYAISLSRDDLRVAHLLIENGIFDDSRYVKLITDILLSRDVSLLEKALKRGLKINADDWGVFKTPLENGDVEIIKVLLKNGIYLHNTVIDEFLQKYELAENPELRKNYRKSLNALLQDERALEKIWERAQIIGYGYHTTKKYIERKRRRRLAARMRAFSAFSQIPKGKVGSMVWAETQGNFYARNGLPEHLKKSSSCMNANYNISKSDLPKYVQYTKDHIYFIAKGLGLPATRAMTKAELCDLVSSAETTPTRKKDYLHEYNKKYWRSDQYKQRVEAKKKRAQPAQPVQRDELPLPVARGLFDDDE